MPPIGSCSVSISGATLKTLIEGLACLISYTIPIAAAIALLIFFWGVYQAFGRLESVEKRTEVRQTIVWSLVALFVIVTLGGIIAIFLATFPDLQPR